MNKYDIIIIGSGLGGLVCGYILSKHGYKVAILEQGTQIGGCLQTFRRSGVVFDTGMHYIGSMDEGQILYRLFDYLDLLKDVRLNRLDENGYDVFNIAGEEFRYASGYENFIDTLAASFPHQKQEISNYVRGIRDIADGDYISGAVRLLDAILRFLCIAIGVGAAFSVYQSLAGGVML